MNPASIRHLLGHATLPALERLARALGLPELPVPLTEAERRRRVVRAVAVRLEALEVGDGAGRMY